MFVCSAQRRRSALPSTGIVRVVLVELDEIQSPGVPIERRAWLEQNAVSEIQRFDVGIMPLQDDYWERSKSGFELIQCIACGRPVVTSPVCANTRIIDHSESG